MCERGLIGQDRLPLKLQKQGFCYFRPTTLEGLKEELPAKAEQMGTDHLPSRIVIDLDGINLFNSPVFFEVLIPLQKQLKTAEVPGELVLANLGERELMGLSNMGWVTGKPDSPFKITKLSP